MADKSVSFNIDAKDNATSVLTKLSGNLNIMAKSISASTSGITKVTNAFYKLNAAAPGLTVVTSALSKAFQTVRSAAKECEQAFSQLEQSEKRLNFAASLNGKLGETSSVLKQFASDLSASLNNSVAGGDILSAIIPVAYDKTAEQLKKITVAGADLAAAVTGDLDSAVKKLNQTLAGEAGELANIFPELKNFTKEQMI